MKRQLNDREPREFQVDLVRAQEERKDALCQAATGQGKTAIAAGPYALAQNADRVTLMVSPLIGLQDEMVTTFRDEFKLSAVAVNSAHGGCSPELMAEIVHGKYRIVLLSPEMLLSRRFIDNVLRHPAFARRIYSVVIDEAHCISHWGADFRKKYSQIGMIRVFLPRNTPFIAVSASLTRRVSRDIVEKLQMDRRSYVYRNLGNDRSNVSLVVRAIQNSMQSYSDLDFVIPNDVASAVDIPKTWIYADNITTGAEIIDYLRSLLPPHLHGVIRPYNAVHGIKYREEAMSQFRSGNLRILVCTDAAGMGCNIPDIDIVVQWKLPGKLSSFIQRAGRAARGPNTVGLAVLLVEPSAYSVELTEKTQPGNQAKIKGGRKNPKIPADKGKKKEKANYAKTRGRYRGGLSGDDTIHRIEQPAFNEFDETEGLMLFAQYTKCRRELLRDIFDNPQAEPVVPCCDVCCPELFDRTRPGVKPRTRSVKRLTYGNAVVAVETALLRWQNEVVERDNTTYLTASCILPNDAVRKLSTLKPLTAAAIEGYLSHQW
ncbi:P-loop containing nucleoside triphosphate hydrolase protein, partial [Dentipellis sp. KUC8613]